MFLSEPLATVVVTGPALAMTLEGAPANDFFRPYRPAPGTLPA